jgi:hypothetical protein
MRIRPCACTPFLQLDGFRSAPFASDVAAALQSLIVEDPDPAARRHAAWTVARTYASFAALERLRAGVHDPEELVRHTS